VKEGSFLCGCPKNESELITFSLFCLSGFPHDFRASSQIVYKALDGNNLSSELALVPLLSSGAQKVM